MVTDVFFAFIFPPHQINVIFILFYLRRFLERSYFTFAINFHLYTSYILC